MNILKVSDFWKITKCL